MDERRAAGRQTGEGLLREVRPLDHDAKRSRQRALDLLDRRCAAAPGRVRHLPHWPMDRRPQGLTISNFGLPLGADDGRWRGAARAVDVESKIAWPAGDCAF